MKQLTVARSAGFCFGVNRAVQMVYEALSEGKRVATLGPIIHNTDVVNDMIRKGARVIEHVEDLEPGEYVVIRSHGVERAVYEKIARQGNPMIDATCPFVKRIHKIVAEKTAQGYFILIAGDEHHPEVQGIIGHCDQNYFVFKDEFVLKAFFEKNPKIFEKKLAIVAQTTYNNIIWEECLKVLPKDPNVVVFDTICSATEQRQSDAAALAAKSDCMIVIGGRHSSNTVKLYDVSSSYCKTYHIENADELNTLDLFNADRIGITAGASTPAHIIKEVVTAMEEILNKENTTEEEIDFAQAIDETFKKLHTGARVKGTVMSVSNSEVIVDLGTKQTGTVPASELSNDPSKKPADLVSVGDEIEMIVIKVSDQDGIATLSKKRVDEQAGLDRVIKAKEEGEVLTAPVSAVVKGGVNVYYEGVRIFIPASQTGLPREASLDGLKGQEVKFIILEAPERRKSAVGSIKAVTRKEKEAAKAKFWETAEIGKEYEGEVKSLTSYGAFVDLGGIDGMVHISELSWNRIKHPSQVVSVGDVLKVYIKDLDQENDRISLGYKRAEDNPWEKFKENYEVGDVVTAKIVSITSFGAFAQIIDGVDGLIHISQLADRRVENVKDVVSVGDEVQVKIIGIDLDNKRISISIRELLEDADDADYDDEDEE
ncbi:MAG: bifunctional 4-hydroxy-3-methylbut-2-enyl diphosphate reductase/30S ribosomal protein S1 [Oscillospiraceae bacterium]|nr:bifunctional 4-hydroxy-3-methylbut-2-enyl diphosphate reductase/30S ribosomal protein S1 [Oscillospiraceae bacterium]